MLSIQVKTQHNQNGLLLLNNQIDKKDCVSKKENKLLEDILKTF